MAAPASDEEEHRDSRWRADLRAALVDFVEEGLTPQGRRGERGMTTDEIRAALGPGRVVMPPPGVIEGLERPRGHDSSARIAVPIRNRDGEVFVLDLQGSLNPAYTQFRLLRVERANASEPVADLLRCAIESAGAHRGSPSEVVPLPAPRTGDMGAEDAREVEALRLAGGDVAAAQVIAPVLEPSFRWRTVPAGETRSRVAGVPIGPDGFEWPRRRSGRPLAFLAQLDLQELPQTEFGDLLPARGVLAFFYDAEAQPWGFEESQDGWHVAFWSAETELAPISAPTDLEPIELATQHGLAASVAYSGDLYEAGLADDVTEALYDAADADDPPVMRMLGHPDEIQGDPRAEHGANWLLLMQFDSGAPLRVEFGDAGRLYFLANRDDVSTSRFDRVRLHLQCY